MRAVLQRVSEASVSVDGDVVGRIGHGLLVLLGVGEGDSCLTAEKAARKISKMRIFEDENCKMNLSVDDIQGEILAVSQFTLLGDASRGNRPSFTKAAPPEIAEGIYDHFCSSLKDLEIPTAKGSFGKHMHVRLINDGPVTIVLDITEDDN